MFYESEEREVVEVSLEDFASECGIELVQGSKSGKMSLCTVNVNRPGLLLAGFEDYFGDKRVQVIGNAESYYIDSCTEEEKERKLNAFFSRKIPCVIMTSENSPREITKKVAAKYDVPIYRTGMTTSQLMNIVISYLNKLLAPYTTMHGVLLEVSGTGVLITGHSGMGKSETALELVHRGHKLVADDNVILKKIEGKIVGSAPEKIRHFMEVRGIGIINIQSMFGVGSVLMQKDVSLVVELKPWKNDMEYDRLGLDSQVENILGAEIPKISVPVMPGRNLAIVVEVAARNQRLKNLGYSAVDELLAKAMLDRK